MEKDFKKDLKVDTVLPSTAKEIYDNYVKSQKDNFKYYLNFVRELLWTLKQYRLVSKFTKFTARIKARESALKNDSSKALTDVFGMEIDASSKEEVEFICLFLESTLTKTKENMYNKDNGYKAHHYSGFPTIKEPEEKLKKILTNKYYGEEVFQEYINSISDRIKERWIEKEMESRKKQGIISSDEECATYIREAIRGYCIEYYDKINEYIARAQDILNTPSPKRNFNDPNRTRLNDLTDELKDIVERYYGGDKAPKKENTHIPIIEIQYKTIDIATKCNDDIGEMAHGVYKGNCTENTQMLYDMTRGSAITIPEEMYSCTLESYYIRNDDGNIVGRRPANLDELGEHEMIEALYPSVVTYVPRITREEQIR